MTNNDQPKVNPIKTYEIACLQDQNFKPTNLTSEQLKTIIDSFTYFVLPPAQFAKLKLIPETINNGKS